MTHKDKCKFLLLAARKLKEHSQISCAQFDLLKELIFDFDEELYACASFSSVKGRVDRYTRQVYDTLFDDLTLERAHIIATTYADELNEADTRALVYGEVDFDSFAEVLRSATDGIARTGKFIDLGHGTGRAVLVAALLCDFEEYVGIEILKGLYETSVGVLSKYKRNIEPMLSGECGVVGLVHGSFLSSEEDWADADLVFANSTCFPDELIEDIATRCRKLAVKSRVITFTTSLRSEYFKIIFKKRLFMSWGPATVFIHERIPDGEVVPGVYDRFSQSYRASSLVPYTPASPREQATDTSSVGSGSAFSMIPVPPIHVDDESSLATTPTGTVVTTLSAGGDWDPDTPTLKAWAKQELDLCRSELDENNSTSSGENDHRNMTGSSKSPRTNSLSSRNSGEDCDDGDDEAGDDDDNTEEDGMEYIRLNMSRSAFRNPENGIYSDDDDELEGVEDDRVERFFHVADDSEEDDDDDVVDDVYDDTS